MIRDLPKGILVRDNGKPFGKYRIGVHDFDDKGDLIYNDTGEWCKMDMEHALKCDGSYQYCHLGTGIEDFTVCQKLKTEPAFRTKVKNMMNKVKKDK